MEITEGENLFEALSEYFLKGMIERRVKSRGAGRTEHSLLNAKNIVTEINYLYTEWENKERCKKYDS
jgi:hypothetical protein